MWLSINPGAIQRTTVGGIPASYSTARVNTQSGQVDVTVFAYEFSRTSAFHFVALTKAGGAGVFNSMFGSVRRLSASEAAASRPRHVDVVTVGRSVEEACVLAVQMERAATLQLLACRAGAIRAIDRESGLQARDWLRSPRRLEATFAHYARRELTKDAQCLA